MVRYWNGGHESFGMFDEESTMSDLKPIPHVELTDERLTSIANDGKESSVGEGRRMAKELLELRDKLRRIQAVLT